MSGYIKEFLTTMQSHGDLGSAERHAKFFQAYSGGYGDGDKFWGIPVPTQRNICKKYHKLLSMEELAELICFEVHEVRLTTLMMLVTRFEKSKDEREAIVQLYLDNLDYVNNWDLVDSSAHYILGPWLLDKPHNLLFELANTNKLWQQRIAVISSYHFIKKNRYDTTLQLAELLLHHKHDLIHKAVGWMLREIGNRDYATEYAFLKQLYHTMPRTMLRYAIERFDEDVRQDFLKGRI